MKKYIFFAALVSLIFFYLPVHAVEDRSEKENQDKQTGVDTLPIIIKSVEAVYPIQLRIKGIEGKVVLRFIITKEGDVENLSIIESIPSGVFDKYVLTAIKQYLFKPAIKNGEPVDCDMTMPMLFSLREESGKDTISGYDAYKAGDEGLKYLSEGEYDKAMESFSKAIEIYSKFSAAYSGRGIAYMEKGDYSKAMSDFDKAIKIDPEVAVFYQNRGKLYTVMEDYQKAIGDYTKAINIDPANIESYNSRGDSFRKTGKYQDSIEDYTKVISMDGSYVQAYNNRGYCYNKLKDIDHACIDLKKACELGDCRGFEIVQKAGKCNDNASNPSDIVAGDGSLESKADN